MRWYFNDPATGVMAGIIDLHDLIMCILICIFILVVWMLFTIIEVFKGDFSKFTWDRSTAQQVRVGLFYPVVQHSIVLELGWTIIPTLILIAISVPSFSLLYLMDKPIHSELDIKIMGKQWYWFYEYAPVWLGDKKILVNYGSYMIPTEDLEFGQLRLLEVDNPLVVPVKTKLKFLVTSGDVIHSFSVPSLGIKMDAVPGRLNRVFCEIEYPGVYRGQCSELCGVDHAYMPIVVQCVEMGTFKQWLAVQGEGEGEEN